MKKSQKRFISKISKYFANQCCQSKATSKTNSFSSPSWHLIPSRVDLKEESKRYVGIENAWDVTLKPVIEDDRQKVFDIVQDEEIWRYIPRPPPIGEKAFEPFFRDMLSQTNRKAYLIMKDQEVVGSTSFYDWNEHHRSIEIGYTHLARSYWKTTINTQAKLMMLTIAFEHLNMIRVQFRTDEENVRSQIAIERLGATREGIRRKDQIKPNGHPRNCVFYSILEEEWPLVKANLVAKLKQQQLIDSMISQTNLIPSQSSLPSQSPNLKELL